MLNSEFTLQSELTAPCCQRHTTCRTTFEN